MSILVTYPRTVKSFSTVDNTVTAEWNKHANDVFFAKVTQLGHLIYRKGDSVMAASVKSSPKTVCNTVKSYDSCDRFIYALKPNNLDVFSVSLKKENFVKIPANRTCLAPNPVDKSVLLGCGNSGEIHRVSLVNYSVKELTISKQPVAPIKAGLLQIAPLHASKNKVAILRGEALGANEAGILDISKGVVNTFPGFPSLYPTKALRCSPVTDSLCFAAGYNKTIKLFDTREMKMINENATDLNIQFADFLDAQKIVFSCMLGGVYLIDLRNSEKITTISAPFASALIESSITLDSENKAASILAELQSPTVREKPTKIAAKRQLDNLTNVKTKMAQSPLAKYSSSARIEQESEKVIHLPKPEVPKTDKILKAQLIPSAKENQMNVDENSTHFQPVAQNAELGKITGLLETLVTKVSSMEDKMASMEKRIEELEAPIKETRNLITFPMESDSARPLQADMRAQVTDPLKRKIERLEFFLEQAIQKINVLTENNENDNEELKEAVSNLADQIEKARQPMSANQLIIPDWRL
ncbi:unnamed protein product [Oikopleura dioica]|uniref:Uncharacterized protein n=1 Tax=Oikopleura dioica TaxID=34765 RepID=E4XUL4_OIKDI|nr:unnamed protein product [Oikopleura dioica]